MIGSFVNSGAILVGSLIGKEIIMTLLPGKMHQMNPRLRGHRS
jgi:hypothetical protein